MAETGMEVNRARQGMEHGGGQTRSLESFFCCGPVSSDGWNHKLGATSGHVLTPDERVLVPDIWALAFPLNKAHILTHGRSDKSLCLDYHKSIMVLDNFVNTV